MGIRFLCPNGHKLNVKEHLAGKRGICPQCEVKFFVPSESGGQAEAVNGPAAGTYVVEEKPPTSQTVAQSQEVSPTATLSMAAPLPPPAASAAAPPTQADTPAEVWYVRTEQGEQFGPVGIEVMKGWVAEGRVAVDSWVWRTGWPDWKTGGQAITFLNVPSPNVPGQTGQQPAAPVLQTPNAEPTPTPEIATTDLPGQQASDASLPTTSTTANLYRSTKRSRQERARKVTLFLGVVVLILSAVLVAVLINNSR